MVGCLAGSFESRALRAPATPIAAKNAAVGLKAVSGDDGEIETGSYEVLGENPLVDFEDEKSDYSDQSSVPSLLQETRGALRFSTGGYRRTNSATSGSSTVASEGAEPQVGASARRGYSSEGTQASNKSFHSLHVKDFDEHYQLLGILGAGSFGCVREARCTASGKSRAVKIIYAKDRKQCLDAETEIASIAEFDHPNLVKLHCYCDNVTGTTFYMVMDLMAGGTLRQLVDETLDAIKSVAHSPGLQCGLPPAQSARYLWQMLAGVHYLHHNGFVHRDIKPENYLLTTMRHSATLKLSDFGFTVRVGRYDVLTRTVGSPHCMAPEVRRRAYGQAADMWSLGVSAHFMCCGHLPFFGKADEYIKQAQEGVVRADAAPWAPHPARTRMLVESLLVVDPGVRPTAKQVVQQNPWLEAYGDEGVGCCTVS